MPPARKPKPEVRPIHEAGLIQVPEIGRLLSDPEGNIEGIVKNAFEGLGEDTLRSYGKSWDDFTHFLKAGGRGEAALLLIRGGAGQANAIVMKYKADLIGRNLAPSTVNVRLAAIRSVMGRLRIMGLLNWDVEIRGLKVHSYKDTRGPGADKILAVVKEIETRVAAGEPGAIRDVAMLHIFYKAGLRRNEIASLDLEHLEFEKNRIWVLGKGHYEREPITIPPKSREALRRWVELRLRMFPPKSTPAEIPVFVSLDRKAMGNRLTGDGIYKIVIGYGLGRPHGLRHTSITEALKKTKDPALVQKHSRHKDLRTLMIYNDNLKDGGGEVASLLDQDF